MKDIDRQSHGGINSITGNRYEADFAVSKLVEMLIVFGSDEKIILLIRQYRGHIDDVYYKTDKKSEYYCQCKKSGLGSDKQKVLDDFLAQFRENRNCNLILITQSKPKHLDTLTNDADKYRYDEFIKRLEEDTQLKKHKELFDSLCEKSCEKHNDEDTKIFTYEFLKKLKVKNFDDGETEIVDRLTHIGYRTDDAKRTYDRFIQKISAHEWLARQIDINLLKDELTNMNIRFISPHPGEILLPKQRKTSGKKLKRTTSVLDSPDTMFTEKLSYILDLISNLNKPRPTERKKALDIIKKDSLLSWHFFRNLKDPDWFFEIRDTVIKSTAKERGAPGTKYQLLNFLNICTEKYSDDIIPVLIVLEKSTKNTDALSTLIKTIAGLKPSDKKRLEPIWGILDGLVEHQHPWVRKEIPGTLKALAEYDLHRSLNLLEKLLLFCPTPREVTRGSPTLALTFQGRDNENWVFEQSARMLSQLMSDPRFTLKTLNLAIKLETQFIRGNAGEPEIVSDITLDYSYIWFTNENPRRKLEYEYDRRKRLAFEIEKCLDVFAVSNTELANELFTKLLQANHEVFYLIVITVLTRHPDKHLDLIENIVFNKDLWMVRNIRNYFLQKLVQTYLNIRQYRLKEYIESVKSLSYENDQTKTDHLKQDLLAIIPERLRSEEVRQELKQLEVRLNTPARIEKPFVFTSFSGPIPDITLDEVKKQNNDELVKIMEDCTAGRRRADPYDLSHIFGELIKADPNRLPDLLDKMKRQNIALDFAGCMVEAYIGAKQSNLQNVIDLFWKLQDTDTWARCAIARFLDKECRKKEILEIPPDLLQKIKEVLFDLAVDQYPDNDETMKSSRHHPEDAIDRGINSIRGITAEALVALAYYFPKDKEITKKIKILSQDKTNAVKATLIYNLRFLTRTNYSLCKSITNQFTNIRDPEIDFALIYYFSSLTPQQLRANLDFVKLLLNNTNKEIQKLLGELISTRYISGCNYLKQFIYEITEERVGEVEARESLAFQLASCYALTCNSKKQKRIMDVLVQLVNPQLEENINVRERASFLFTTSGLRPQHFGMLYKSGIFDSVLKDKMNVTAQSNVIQYLERCILADKTTDMCLEILHKQALNIDRIWDDQMIIQRIANILRKIFESNVVNDKSKSLADEIFDKGLERGWKEFYKLFYDFKHTEQGAQS